MNKSLKILTGLVAAMNLVTLSTSAEAASTKSVKTTGISFTYPATITLKSKGCMNIPVQFLWAGKVLKDHQAGSSFSIEDANDNLIGTGGPSRMGLPKAGTVNIKICRDPWKLDVYNDDGTLFGADEYVGARKGTFYVSVSYYNYTLREYKSADGLIVFK